MSKSRLLIVDDEPSHIAVLTNALEDAGYQVTASTSAHEALAALRGEPFDLLLTDLKMPEMDGITLLRAAHAIDPHLVAVMMTGHATLDTAIEAMKAGALDYVLKPFKLSTLTPVLSRALEMRRLRTEIAHLQHRVQEHVVELEATNQELESFSYSVSHDLRAPLRAISGFSNILMQNYAEQLPDDARHLLNRIATNTERMGLLIEHLLRLTGLSRQPLSKQIVKIPPLVHDVIEELQKDTQLRSVEIEIGTLPDAVGDPVLLRQVFVNLLSNAFKFTRNNDHPRIVVGHELHGQEHTYFVRDNGVGFDLTHADNLFRVFYRLHSDTDFEGSGVGLSLVQRIVQRHGGRIWCDAQVNAGATFYFSLGH